MCTHRVQILEWRVQKFQTPIARPHVRTSARPMDINVVQFRLALHNLDFVTREFIFLLRIKQNSYNFLCDCWEELHYPFNRESSSLSLQQIFFFRILTVVLSLVWQRMHTKRFFGSVFDGVQILLLIVIFWEVFFSFNLKHSYEEKNLSWKKSCNIGFDLPLIFRFFILL